MLRDSPIGATALLVALTVMLTWPQGLHLGTAVPSHDDPFLSMWRLGWIAHALSGTAGHLFDGNIFHPHARTLAYSDATLLQGLIAAPWLWARANPVLVYNLLFLGGIVTSGVGMFVLVRYLTNNADAALVSAAIFTVAPYRIEHVMHLELQWTMWMPLSLWAVHRVFERPSLRRGAVVGVLLSLQVLSCMYYGVFLGMIVAALTVLLAVSQPRRARAAWLPLCAGAMLPAVVAAAYALPYLENARVLGTRDPGEIRNFSAQFGSYVAAPQHNWLWGWTAFRFNGNELHLFPGLVVVALAAVALMSRPRRRIAWIYLTLAALAIELSLGMNGVVYPWLHGHVRAFEGFRAPARFGILVVCALAVLAAFGFEYLQRLVSARRALLVAVLLAVAIECGSMPVSLEEVPQHVPDLYKFLKGSGRSVVIEFPIVDWNLTPLYMFWSTQHWNPLVNGYSGYIPRDYAETLERMRTFPDDAAILRLRQLGVRYIVIHEYFYTEKERTRMTASLAGRPELIASGRYRDWVGTARLFEFKRTGTPPSAVWPDRTPSRLPDW